MCKHINEHWNNEHLKRLVYNASLYLICRLGIILTTCLRAGTVWPILRRKWKTLSGSRVNTTGFQMPRKAQHRVQTHWDHFRTRDHFSLGAPNRAFLIAEHHISTHFIENQGSPKVGFWLGISETFQMDSYDTVRLLLVFYPTLRASRQDPGILSQNRCAAPGQRPTVLPLRGRCGRRVTVCRPIGHALQLAGAGTDDGAIGRC